MRAIIVPYRNRPEQLRHFTKFIASFLHGVEIVIVEQTDDKQFNRGKLINVGFLETNPSFFIAHDIDMMGEFSVYTQTPHFNVAQLANSEIQKIDYLGGVTMYAQDTFVRSEGYHNDYFHRAEDNEMMFNLKRKNIKVDYFNFKFDIMPHPRTGPEFIPELWAKAQLPRKINMLENCHYELISKEVFDTHTHIRVLL